MKGQNDFCPFIILSLKKIMAPAVVFPLLEHGRSLFITGNYPAVNKINQNQLLIHCVFSINSYNKNTSGNTGGAYERN